MESGRGDCAAETSNRSILHVDMDAFYASVEQRDNPELRGRPVVVGGSTSGRGVVCAASYEAREFGVHSAMPAKTAYQLCPSAVFVRPRMDHYAGVSKLIRRVFDAYTPLVQPLSLDEAFLDVTGSLRLFGQGDEIGRKIKHRILAETGLVASVGLAPNKFLAKVASDLDKPDGFCVVRPDGIQVFLDPLEVKRVWGVGKVGLKKLDSMGVRTIRQLRAVPAETLIARFGKWGEQLHRLCRGEDDRPVVPDRTAKSVSHETTFREDVADREMLAAWTRWLSEQVGRRLRRHGLKGQSVQVKLRDSGFDTRTRSRALAAASNRSQEISQVASELLNDAVNSFGRGCAFRLVGVGVANLDQSGVSQGLLFDGEQAQKETDRDRVTDEIAQKFGKLSIRPGSSLRLPKGDRANPYEGQ